MNEGGFQLGSVDFALLESRRHRVRIPDSIANEVTWLNVEPKQHVPCRLIPQAPGGIQVWPSGGAFETAQSLTASGLNAIDRLHEEPDSEILRLTRLFSIFWNATVHYEPSSVRFAITIPEEVRKIGLLPDEGTLAFFAKKDLLEIWPSDAFISHVRSTKADL